MAVKVRLARIGTKHVPYYRIVAVDSRNKRDGAYLENLGTYDAQKTAVVALHTEKIDAWVAKGAVLSDTVKKIYTMHKKAATKPANTLVKKVAKKAAAKAEQKEVPATEEARVE